MTLYKAKDLKKKYKGKFINVYPHHHKHWNNKTNQYETVYEVRGISNIIKENYQAVKEIIN